ncbi:MAG: hypothetical protein GEU73_07755 [Chloroflexi bacterium]|nr:hypothetical protein [Chloroflexota bacterium]
MSYRSAPIYWAVCDFPGCDWRYPDPKIDEHAGWIDRGTVDEMATATTYWDVRAGRHLCTDHGPFCVKCGAIPEALSGEREYLCERCWSLVPVEDRP